MLDITCMCLHLLFHKRVTAYKIHDDYYYKLCAKYPTSPCMWHSLRRTQWYCGNRSRTTMTDDSQANHAKAFCAIVPFAKLHTNTRHTSRPHTICCWVLSPKLLSKFILRKCISAALRARSDIFGLAPTTMGNERAASECGWALFWSAFPKGFPKLLPNGRKMFLSAPMPYGDRKSFTYTPSIPMLRRK